MCSTAKNKVSCLTVCHVWFSLNNDQSHLAFSTNTYLTARSKSLPSSKSLRSNQDFRDRGRKRHPESPFFSELIISLFPSYFFDLKGFFLFGFFFPLALFTGEHKYGQKGVIACLSKPSVSTPSAKLHNEYFTPSDLKHWMFGVLPEISLTELVAPTGNQSLDHPVFREALTNLCKQACWIKQTSVDHPVLASAWILSLCYKRQERVPLQDYCKN